MFGVWIGTLDREYCACTRADRCIFIIDGLTSSAVGFFEDREGNVWVRPAGLDRLREYAIPISVDAGFIQSLCRGVPGQGWYLRLGTTDWFKDHGRRTSHHLSQTNRGHNRAEPRQPSQPLARQSPRMHSNITPNYIDSLYQDDQGRIWVATHQGLGYFENSRFIPFSRHADYLRHSHHRRQ